MNLKNFFVAAFVLALATWSTKAADNPAIVGTAQLKEYTQVILDIKEVSRPFNDHPTRYIQYSPGRHMLVFLMAGQSKQPASANPTDAARAEVHKQISGSWWVI